MTRAERTELERLVQLLDRQYSGWSASEIEAELARRAPVAYGNWKDDTPAARSRLRQVQRWRRGETGAARRRRSRPPYAFVWPVGERQRQSLETTFPARPLAPRASHRLFVYNCSSETVRELRVQLDGVRVTYEPALRVGGFAEIHWTRNHAIRDALLAATEHQISLHPLEVEFAVSNGAKRAFLKGVLRLDSTDGWNSFRSDDRTEREIE